MTTYFTTKYLSLGTEHDISSYIADLTLEQELEKFLDLLTLKVSRKIATETFFTDFTPAIEIVLYKDATKIFRGRVKTAALKELYEVEVFSSGEELARKNANKTYESQSPEAIFSNLITTYTSLTPSTPAASGVTLDRFTAFDYVGALISKLAQIMDWQVKTDANLNIYFQPRGYTVNTSKTIYRTATGANAVFGKWDKNSLNLCNYVVLRGGDVEYSTSQSFNGDGIITDFTLSERPESVKVTVGGTEQTRDAYTVKAESKKIVFASPPPSGTGNVVVTYTYVYPVYLERRDNTSIAQYNNSFIKMLYPKWLHTYTDARQYATAYLGAYSQPLRRNIIKVPLSWVTLVNPGDRIRVDDDIEGIDEYFVIQKIKTQYTSGYMELSVGSYIPQLPFWQLEVQQRIKDLENNLTTEILSLYDNETESMAFTDTLTEASANFINFKLATSAAQFNSGRGSANDSRFNLSKFEA